MSAQLKAGEIAAYIDHTILKPEARTEEVLAYCAEARQHGFKSVCVNGVHVAGVAKALAGSEVLTCAVIGFPLGASGAAQKALEASRAVADGAAEIDMVIDIGALKDGRLDDLKADIDTVRAAVPQAVLKVIIETCLLTDDEKRAACLAAKAAGADFVKTSTGFSKAGATVADIALMRATVGPSMGVKASGGVRTLEDAKAMIAAGATRIGASASVAIVTATSAAASDY
ncbi:deoxyribose-phosphate aldolase [Arboricoccus pini]|uniref:Deoxyribose-phosphate aldolase n=1 Tax=Arboricoccus pini TaxID=1963835 RepID=A0A212RWW5_9PROT|nr:deoxyribose-phosphate aldolase [Arboricoccus pini]SNB77247.1 deoxyribose-phosphate aldolase [Arboricoccus pini]